MLTEAAKVNIKECCSKIAKILGLKQGSAEIHYHRGEPKEVHVHDKSIKFKDSDTN